jgi:O-antigen/teichoic acid export membrane protein
MNNSNKILLQNFKQRLLNSKFVSDSFWALLGNVLGRGLSLVAGIVVARFLGKEIYGEYGIIKNTIFSLAIFSTFGLGYTATKYVAEFKNKQPEYLNLILKYSRIITLIVSGLIALLLFAFAEPISDKILKAPHLYTSIRLVSVWVIIRSLTTTQIGIIAGFGQFKKMAKIEGIVGIITFILSVIFTYVWGLMGALFALLTAQIVNLILNYRLVEKNKPANKAIKKDPKFLKDIISFSTPVAMQEILYAAMGWTLHYLLIQFANYGELGLYSAAMQWNALILFIPGVLRNVILSHLSENTNNSKQHRKILNNTLIINFVSTFLPFLAVYIFTNFVISFYGESFVEMKSVLRVSVFATIFISLSNVYAQAYLSKGKSWLMFGIRAVRDVGKIILGYYLLVHIQTISGAVSLAYTQLTISIVFLVLMAGIYKLNLKKWR